MIDRWVPSSDDAVLHDNEIAARNVMGMGMTHPATADVVRAIYLAAHGGASWDGVAASLRAVAGNAATVNLRMTRQRSDQIIASDGLSAEAVRDYTSHYFAINPYTPLVQTMPPGRPITTADARFDLAATRAGAFYNEFMAPHEIGIAGIGLNSSKYGDNYVTVAINYGENETASLDPVFRSILLDISAHLAEAVRIAAHNAAGAKLAGFLSALSVLPTAALALNGEGRVIGGNTAAEAILQQGPLYVDRAKRLRSKMPRLNRHVEAAVRAALPPKRSTTHFCAKDYGPVGDVLVTVMGLAEDCEGVPHWAEQLAGVTPAAAVYLMRDDSTAADTSEALRAFYSLSCDQVRAAQSIYHGWSTERFAAAHNLSVYEARRLKDRTMEKLGAHTVADVVRRLAMLGQLAGPARERASRAG